MRVQGRQFDSENLYDELRELGGLPSGLKIAIVPISAHNPEFSHPGYHAYYDAMQLVKNAQRWGNPKACLKARAMLFEALTEYQKTAEETPIEQGICHHGLAEYYRFQGQDLSELSALLEAKKLYEDQDYLYGLYSVLPDLVDNYRRRHAVEKNSKLKQLMEEKIYSYCEEIESRLSDFRKVGLQEDAYFIGQGEVGYSSDQPIGTDNVHDCIAVAVQEPKSKKMALAHLDSMSDYKSLHDIFANLPEVAEGEQYKVRLIGARYAVTWRNKFTDISRKNIANCLNVLSEYPTEIISSQTGHTEQLSNFVVDPKDFSVNLNSAAIGRNEALQYSGSLLRKLPNRPLHQAFDLTKSLKRAPILIAAKEYHKFMDTALGESFVDLLQTVTEGSDHNSFQALSNAVSLYKFRQKLSARYEEILQEIEPRLSYLEQYDADYTESTASMFKGLIGGTGFHLGEGAEICDQPFLNCLKNDVLPVTETGEVGYHPGILMKFEHCDQPYQTLEKTFPRKAPARNRLMQFLGSRNRR